MTRSTVSTRPAGRRAFTALATVAATALMTVLLPAGGASAAPAAGARGAITPAVVLLTGDAYGLEATGLLPIAKTPEAGPVSTTGSSSVAPCVLSIPGPISADVVCASVVTAPVPATSTAKASAADVKVNLLGLLPVIEVGAVQSTSVTTCAGSTGGTTVASISVGGMPLTIPANPAPNTTISLLGITLVLNEQIPTATGLTVNAVHVKALGLVDAIVASSTSGVSGC